MHLSLQCFPFILLGTRFRPLSFDCPKPLFPVAGEPMLSHLIEACCRITGLIEICIIGWYQVTANDAFTKHINDAQRRFDVPIRSVFVPKAVGFGKWPDLHALF